MIVAYDTETWAVQPGLLAPPLVCASTTDPRPMILSVDDARSHFVDLLRSDVTIAGANIAYDMTVMAADAAGRGVDLMPEIFAAYSAGRVHDVLLVEALDAIALGTLGQGIESESGRSARRYSLWSCVASVLGRRNAKENDAWRLRYGELAGIPMVDWPREALQYPIDDVVNTLEVAQAQLGQRVRADGVCRRSENINDLPVQAAKAFALHLGAVWGIRVDASRVSELARAATAGRHDDLERFISAGFLRSNGTENTACVRRAMILAYDPEPAACSDCTAGRVPSQVSRSMITCAKCNGSGLAVPAGVQRTEPTKKFPQGQIKIGRDALFESGDPVLIAYGALQEDNKILETYVPFLTQGNDAPINLRPNPILETGRVSYDGVIQLLPRRVSSRLSARLREIGSSVIGVRDCIVPRPGHVFYSVDYTAGELVTFAESAVHRMRALKEAGLYAGESVSQMGAALCAGRDVHAMLGASMAGIRYEDYSSKHKAFRQAAKAANFGFPGGMGASKLVLQQRQSGPDTDHPVGPADLGDGRRGYRGMRFCVLVGGRSSCSSRRVTTWRDRPCALSCVECLEIAEGIRTRWFLQWPEAREYLRWHGLNADNVGSVTQLYSGRIRGGIDFCSAANGDFQGLLADIAGRAQIRVTYEQYADRRSVLYGSRSILFAHDELFGEAPIDRAPEIADRVRDIMVEEFRRGCPTHAAACRATPALMSRWYKNAEEKRDSNGRLVIWDA